MKYEIIGNASYATANKILLEALGNPWVENGRVRDMAPFEFNAEIPPGLSEILNSQSASVRWLQPANARQLVQVKPTTPSDLVVVVPVYNPVLVELEACLDSILKALRFAQATDFEIILIDDASQVNAAEISTLLDRIRKRESLSATELALRKNSRNAGVVFSRNRGFQENTKTYAYFVDSDDMLHPWYFALLHAELIAGADLATSSMLQLSGPIYCADNKPLNEIFFSNTNGSGIGVRRSTFLKFKSRGGLFNQNNSVHYEDWELNIFSRLAGCKIGVVDAPLYYYRDDINGRNQTNVEYIDYSRLMTPYNAIRAANDAGIEFSGRDTFSYVEILMKELISLRYLNDPNRRVPKILLLYRAFQLMDAAISPKMYMSRIVNFLRTKLR